MSAWVEAILSYLGIAGSQIGVKFQVEILCGWRMSVGLYFHTDPWIFFLSFILNSTGTPKYSIIEGAKIDLGASSDLSQCNYR